MNKMEIALLPISELIDATKSCGTFKLKLVVQLEWFFYNLLMRRLKKIKMKDGTRVQKGEVVNEY